jgi:hypothetical protein
VDVPSGFALTRLEGGWEQYELGIGRLVQSKSASGHRDQNLAAGCQTYAPLQICPLRLETATLLTQVMEPAGCLESRSLSRYNRHRTSQKDEEPE